MPKKQATGTQAGKESKTAGSKTGTSAKVKRSRAISLVEHLALLEAYYQPELADMPWASEDDRWAEFVFCLLYEARGRDDAAITRNAVVTLRYLGLVTIDVLSSVGDGEKRDDRAAAISEVLRSHGFADEAAEKAVRMLVEAATNVDKTWGKLQVFLYNHGQSMLDDLATNLSSAALPEDDLRAAGALWMQNTLNIPVFVDHPAVESLRQRYGATVDELMDAADQAGINLAILDDLVELAEGDQQFEAWLTEAVAS